MKQATTYGTALILALAATAAGAPGDGDAESARAAFERFKALEGVWTGTNEKGVAVREEFAVIADGSCMMETTDFDAHPGSRMVTMFHLDGDRLMLTHYCVARNQPRMVATELSEEGREVLFTFLDGTNLPSRDTGHMDKARYHFLEPNRFTTRWTWYQDGEESWMESFVLTRVTEAEPVRPVGGDGKAPAGMPAACHDADGAIASLAWMTGGWTGEDSRGRHSEEWWTPPAGGTLFGCNRSIKEGALAGFEYLRIEEDEHGISYLASPGGRNPPTPFKLVEVGEGRAVFENPEHDFPQRIIYERRGDELHARNEGEIDGRTVSMEWRWRRVGGE